MRVFLATGEASGDMLGAAFARAIRELEPGVTLRGVGGERMAAAGVVLGARTTGWAAMGPLEALRTIPVILWHEVRQVLALWRAPYDVLVFVDFGAAHVRAAQFLRWLGYRGPIVYALPPGAFMDSPAQARAVARVALPLTAFRHQRDFYRSLGLEIAYFGHPLVSLVAPRAARPAADARGGTIALLPGSRRAELARHVPLLLEACRLLRERRPDAAFVVSAADAEAEETLRARVSEAKLGEVHVVRGARAALDVADAAWIASGTAVLEAALLEVPCVALYVIAPAQVALARRVWQKPYVTLPNILLGREAVPELLQDAATPRALAAALDAVLADPLPQLREVRTLRAQLGPADALERCARYIVAAAQP